MPDGSFYKQNMGLKNEKDLHAGSRPIELSRARAVTVVVSLWDTVRHISLPVGNAVVGLIVGATVGVVVGLNVGATVGVPGDTHDVGA